MLSDQRKFARGYVIRSSLLNETVVTLHACSRPLYAPHSPAAYPEEAQHASVPVSHRPRCLPPPGYL